ncbi:MAG TPA: GNAT family N-acetyltransferase [Puia sp.]|jgi:hypothetical protein|nr:GNAT family N-acetyltransferase [Puia sp.]
MVIQHKQVDNKGMFYVGKDGAIEAELVYTMSSPGKMVIEHTEVNEELKGLNVGKELVQAAVTYARTNNIKIVPLCPYAKSLFSRIAEWRDVLL